MDRPTCSSCIDFVRGVGSVNGGTCHGKPPDVSHTVRIVRRDDDDEPDPHRSYKVHGGPGKWPVVYLDTPCCPRHQDYDAYRDHAGQDSRQVATGKLLDDPADNPF